MTNKLLVDQRTETCSVVSAKWVVGSIFFFCFCLKSRWSVLPWSPPACPIHVWNLIVGVDIIQAGVPKQLEVPTSLELCCRGLERVQALRLVLTASRGDHLEDLVERPKTELNIRGEEARKNLL